MVTKENTEPRESIEIIHAPIRPSATLSASTMEDKKQQA